MATSLVIPKGFGAPAAAFKGRVNDVDEMGAGIASSYAIMGFRGKVWSIKYQGKETPLMREDGDGARGSIEVVIVKASPAIAKIYYKNGYVDGSNAAPDCWSSNGVTPDPYVQNKVNKTCADCPMNAYGSRVTEAGKQSKACSDSKRIAIVPLGDLDNEVYGGPMLLRIPAATLKEIKAYSDTLRAGGFDYYAVATRISFDPAEAFPKLVFNGIRALTNEEAETILALRDDRRTAQVLNETPETRQSQEAAPAAQAKPLFEQATPEPVKAAPKAEPVKAAPKPEPKPEPVKAAPVIEDEDDGPEEAPVAATGSENFDDLLDSIL